MTEYKVYKPTEKPKKLYGYGTLEQPKFIPSYYEYLKEKGQQFLKWNNVQTIFYTVPDDYTLFITNLFMDGVEDGTGVAGTTYSCRLYIEGVYVIRLYFQGATKQAKQIAESYNLPIKLKSKEVINLIIDTPINASCGVKGFLVKNSDILNIL